MVLFCLVDASFVTVMFGSLIRVRVDMFLAAGFWLNFVAGNGVILINFQ